MAAVWTEDTAAQIVDVLGRHDSVVSAAADLGISYDKIKWALRANGYDSPRTYLRGKAVARELRTAAGETRRAARTSETTRLLFIPDMHFPYAHDLTWRTILAVATGWRPDIVVILGDFLDLYTCSEFDKDPSRKASLEHEIETANRELTRLGRIVDGARVIFCEGNHEQRLTRYLQRRAPELYGMIDMPSLLRIKDRGWEWLAYKQHLALGKIHVAHDIGRCGVNAARQGIIDFGGNLIVGHTHQASVVYRGNLRGERHVSITSGWGGDPAQVDYAHAHRANCEWQHGFTVAHEDSTGAAWCTFVPVIEGRAIVDGVVYAGREQ